MHVNQGLSVNVVTFLGERGCAVAKEVTISDEGKGVNLLSEQKVTSLKSYKTTFFNDTNNSNNSPRREITQYTSISDRLYNNEQIHEDKIEV